MNQFMKTLYVAPTLVPMAALAAAQTGTCINGKLVDVQVGTRLIDGGTAERVEEKDKKGGREYRAYSTPLTQQQTIYTVRVRLDDIVYTAQSQSVFGLGFKPTSFIVNDPIHGCVRGNILALTRQDGKEFKARLVRAEREPPLKP